MFKKLKDKIAEEVKSSPQLFEQLAKGVQVVFPRLLTFVTPKLLKIQLFDAITRFCNDELQNTFLFVKHLERF